MTMKRQAIHSITSGRINEMKTFSIVRIILLTAASLAVLSACESFNIGKPVKFTARAHREAGTKTVYGDFNDLGTHQDIYWVDGDQILIQSGDATAASAEGGVTSMVYNLSINSDRKTAAIENVGDNGIVWNETSDVDFYGAYPHNITPRASVGEYDMSIPKTQTYADLIDPSATTDMSHAYMLAKTFVKGGASNVKLDFYPAFTAFEIHLKNRTSGSGGTGDITLTSLSLKSTSDDLSGSYYNQWLPNTVDQTTQCDAGGLSYTASAAGEKEVTINFPANTTISDTKEVAFTLFVLPVKNVTNMSIEVSFVNASGPQTKHLNLKQSGSFIEFAAGKKHRLTGVTLDSGQTWDLYMTVDVIPQQLDREDNVLVDDPSIDNKMSELTVTNYVDANYTTGEIVLNNNLGTFYFFTEVGRWTRWQASLIGTPGVFAFCNADGTILLDANGDPRTTYSGVISGETQYFYIKAQENSPSGRALLRMTAYDNRGNSKVVYDMINFNDFSEYTLIKNTQ